MSVLLWVPSLAASQEPESDHEGELVREAMNDTGAVFRGEQHRIQHWGDLASKYYGNAISAPPDSGCWHDVFDDGGMYLC